MFDILKNLLNRRASRPEHRPTKARPGQPPESDPFVRRVALSTNQPICQSVSVPPPPVVGGESITLPLNKLISRLPDEFRGTLNGTPGVETSVALPLAIIMEQLPKGAVQLPFGVIRRGAPSGVFVDFAGYDHVLVGLPLDEIMFRLNPALLPRRHDQKRVVVPENVCSPFETVNAPRLSPIVPTSNGNGHGNRTVELLPSPARTPATPVVPPPSVPATPPAAASAPRSAPLAPEPKTPPPAPDIAPAPSPEGQRKPVLSREGCLTVALGRLDAKWPGPVQQEINQFNLQNGDIDLPLNHLELALKQGSVIFTWRQLRSWLPALPKPLAESPYDGLLLELPLEVVAPLYVAQRKPNPPRKKITVADSIPNLFGSSSAGLTPAAPAAEEPPAPTRGRTEFIRQFPEAAGTPNQVPVAMAPPAPTPIPFPVVEHSPATQTNTSFFSKAMPEVDRIFGEPGRTSWTPMEIVRKTSGLKGVAGALICTSDGLMVAEQYAALVGDEAFSALMSQAFGRVAHVAKELKLGNPSRLSFVAEGASYEMFRAGRVFLIVVGHPGETLPLPELTAIANQLGRQSR